MEAWVEAERKIFIDKVGPSHGRPLDQFGPAVGTWNYTVSDANYQVVFSHYNSDVIN